MERKRKDNSHDTAALAGCSIRKHSSIGSVDSFKWDDVISENKLVFGSYKFTSRQVFLAIFFGYISVLGVSIVTTVATIRIMGITNTGVNSTYEKNCIKDCLYTSKAPGQEGDGPVKATYLRQKDYKELMSEEGVPEDATGNLVITDEGKINETIGTKGEKGDRGTIGDKGPIGERGPVGNKGAEGGKGPKGDMGDKGYIGDKGSVGERGPAGKKGEDGVKGLPGDKGHIGDKGLPGDKGPLGKEGEVGEKGLRGDKGLPGDKGENGTVGEKGQKGERGEKVPEGADEMTCDIGWQLFGKYCYYFGYSKKTWKDAQKDCVARGGNLVKIDNAVENWFLKSFITDQNFQHVWIGASDIDKEGHMVWVADKTAVKTGFSNWVPGEPNNHRGREHCVHFWKSLANRWNDAWCSDKNGYICKKETQIKK